MKNFLDEHVRIDPRTKQPYLDWPKRFTPETILARFPKRGALVREKRSVDLGVVLSRTPYFESRPGSGSIGMIEVQWIHDERPDRRHGISTGSVELYDH